MSERTPRAIVGEVLESISAIHEYTAQLSENDFVAQRLVHDAVIRRIEILGEAASQLPGEWKPAHPLIPWQIITSMRHRLIHGYFSVDLGLVWEKIQQDLPPLQQQLRQIRQQGEERHGIPRVVVHRAKGPATRVPCPPKLNARRARCHWLRNALSRDASTAHLSWQGNATA